MTNDNLTNEALVICRKRWGFPTDVAIPEWVMKQAELYVNNRENGVRIGELLVAEGLFSKADIDVFESNKPKGVLLGQHICKELEHSKNEAKRTLVQKILCSSKSEGILFVDVFPSDVVVPHPNLQDTKVNKKLLDECAQRNALVVKIAGVTEAVMFSDLDSAKAFRDRLGRPERTTSAIYTMLDDIKIVITSPQNINNHLSRNIESLSDDASKQTIVTEDSLHSTSEHIKIANMWNHAMALKATDIHIEPSAAEADKFVRVRLRIHGEMIDYTDEHKITYQEYSAILGKIGMLTNASQTGGTRYIRPVDPDNIAYINSVRKRTEFRTLIMPKGHGEGAGRAQKAIVMRLFSSDFEEATLDDLNIAPQVANLLKQLCKVPNKLHLIAGTTGSGKNTTIAAMLLEYDEYYDFRKKIYSLEDPVEKLLPNITQIQITKQAVKEFEEMGKEPWQGFLEGIVRADPDALFLGEIRNANTAAIAGQLAASGHELFSTFHATTPRSTMLRILDYFTKSSQKTTFIDSLGSIITQRLVSELCHHCAIERSISDDDINTLKLKMSISGSTNKTFLEAIEGGKAFKFRNREGCELCNHTGIARSIPVNGVLVITEERRIKLLSGDKKDFYDAFLEPDFDITEELINLVEAGRVSPLVY